MPNVPLSFIATARRGVSGMMVVPIELLVRVRLFLRRTQVLGHIPQKNSDAGPRPEATTHRVDEDVLHTQVLGCLSVALPPPFEPSERVLFFGRVGHDDERHLRLLRAL